MQAIEVVFGYGPDQKDKLENLIKYIADRRWLRSFSVFEEWDEEICESIPHVVVKSNRCDEIDDLFSWRDRDVTRKIYYACSHPGCYRRTAGAKTGDCTLFDRGDTDTIHDIHEYCLIHVRDGYSRQIASSLEIVNDSPGQRLWTKILSFKIDKQFFAQRSDLVDEGDYEMGEQLIEYPSPWCGPCSSRESAIEAARECDVEDV